MNYLRYGESYKKTSNLSIDPYATYHFNILVLTPWGGDNDIVKKACILQLQSKSDYFVIGLFFLSDYFVLIFEEY